MVELSIKNDESIKTIRIKTVIPFSFPFSDKMVRLNINNNLIDVDFETAKRDEILNQYFPQAPFSVYINKRKLPNSQAELYKWIENDRFGQLNFMYATFYFFTSENNVDEIKKAIKEKYLVLCADVINHISRAYRLLVNQYFPRNFTQNDILGYLLAFSTNKEDFFDEEFFPNVNFYNNYPDDNLRIDINDFLKYDESIRLHTDLILNAGDFFMENNYRMSVIEADTALESIIYIILEKYYSNITMDTQVREIFLKELLKKRIDDVTGYLNIISPKITDSTEWSNWKEKCHKLRNDVVHKRKKPERIEAQEALSSSKALLELLKDFLYDESDWLLEGKAFIHNRKIAKEYFKKSNAKKPNPDAYYYLGNIEYEAQQYDVARIYFQEALKLAEHAFFYYNIGNCDVAQQLYPNAIKNYDNAINLKFELRDPNNNPYYQKYRILTEQNLNHTTEDIIALFNILVKAFPHNAYLLVLRAKYALKLNDKTLALDDLQKAVNHNSNIRNNIVNDRDFDILKDEDRFKLIMK